MVLCCLKVGDKCPQNVHTRVRQSDVPTEPAISAVNSAENGVSGLDTVGMESMLSIGGLGAELELVKNVVDVASSTPLPEDEPEHVDVVSGMGNQRAGVEVVTSGAEPARSVGVNSQLMSASIIVDAHLEVPLVGLSHLGEPSVDTPDVCNVEALVGWKKVMSAADKSILAKQDMAEVLAMAMDEMGKFLATIKICACDFDWDACHGLYEGGILGPPWSFSVCGQPVSCAGKCNFSGSG